MRKYIFLLLLHLFSLVLSQVGIYTQKPLSQFHIDGGKDNPITTNIPNAVQESNDFVVTSTGFVGIGTINPVVKFDLRSAGLRNAIGLGTTTMTANEAGAGAIRYEPALSRFQISDGTNWETTIVLPTKAVVVARMTNPFSVNYNTDVNITGWEEVKDLSSSFDPVTGIFTAPRDGVYTMLMTYNFVSGPVANSSMVINQFYSPSNNSILGRSFKTFARANEDTQVGGESIVTLRLFTGQTVRPQLRQNITGSGARALRTNSSLTNADAGFNNLAILEH